MKTLLPLYLLALYLLACLLVACGCESSPRAAPVAPSVIMDGSSLEALRQSFVNQKAEVILAGVARVLATDDYLELDAANSSDFTVGTWVSVIDSNKIALAQGTVVANVGGAIHVHFTTTGPRRPQVGDAVIPNLGHR